MKAPEISVELYRAVVEFAGGLPSWVHVLAEIGTDAGLVLFAVIFLLNWWLARGGDPRRMALALVGPVAVVGAYIVSEVTKTLIQQDRPCWSMAVATIAECPAAGDWSFPSNHATIAAGAAGALMVVWRPSRYFALPLAAGMAFSRVFVGVHYPHDVLVGFLIGAILAPILTLLLVGAVTPLIKVMRNKRILHQLI